MSESVLTPEPAVGSGLPALVGHLLIACALTVLGLLTLASSAGVRYGHGPQVAAQPPGPAIAVIWTTLFVAAAVAAWLVQRRRGTAIRPALWLYWSMVALEALWLGLFALGASLWLVLGVILVLDLVAAATVFAFWRVSRPAGLLTAPTVLWMLFGTLLSIAGTALRAP